MPDRIEVRGAGKPGVDYIEIPTPDEALLAALLDERRGYEYDLAAGAKFRHGMPIAATIKAIDAEISRLGGTPPSAATPQPFEVPPRPTTEAEFAELPILDPAVLPEVPAETEPGCTHKDCVLVHPHAGPAVLSDVAASQAGLILDKAQGGYRRRVGPRERKTA